MSGEIHDGDPEVDGGERVALLDRAADAIAMIVVTGQPLTPELAGQFGECHLGL